MCRGLFHFRLHYLLSFLVRDYRTIEEILCENIALWLNENVERKEIRLFSYSCADLGGV